MCRCGYPGCDITPRRDHFCTVCGRAHYSAAEADDCCDFDITPDD